MALSTRPLGRRRHQAAGLARLENSAADDVKAEASLLVDDVLLDAQEVTVKAGKAEPIVFFFRKTTVFYRFFQVFFVSLFNRTFFDFLWRVGIFYFFTSTNNRQ